MIASSTANWQSCSWPKREFDSGHQRHTYRRHAAHDACLRAAIALAYPRAELTFLGHPKRAEVIQHLPYVARVGGIN